MNKYSFVWKKATVKKTDKLLEKTHDELPAKLKETGIRFYVLDKIAVRQVIYVSKRFAEQRKAMEAKISSMKGCLLWVNRSIQAEGNFAYVKRDLDFRRFLLRGNIKVAAEWLLFSLALNILRLHHKIQNRRLESALIVPVSFPVGL